MALKCDCGGEIRETIDNKDECIICGTTIIITKKGDDDMAKEHDFKIDEPAQIPEQTYVEIAEPFGKQFRDAIREAYAWGYADGKQIGEMMREESPQEKVCDVQRQRDRIVEKAKKDVEGLRKQSISGNLYDVFDPRMPESPFRCEVEYVINTEKRTVVALLRGTVSGIIRAKGIAKCAPGDCFNTHIGKAISLRRALGLEVPSEYLNVPNPKEVRVGDEIYDEHYQMSGKVYAINPEYRTYGEDAGYYFGKSKGWLTYIDPRNYERRIERKFVKVTDDSREEVSE